MKRLIFLILFVFLIIGTIAWLTGIESPFIGARTRSVLSQKDKITTTPTVKSEGKSSSSLLLGTNVEPVKPVGRALSMAASAVPSLVTVEVRKGAEWNGDATVKKMLARLATEGMTGSHGGSGFFIDKEGVVLTTFSALLGGFAWTVHTTDGHEYEALLVGADAATDLALLRVEKTDATPVRLSLASPAFSENLLMLGIDAEGRPRVANTMVSSGLMEKTLPEETLTLTYYLVCCEKRRDGWLLLNSDGAAAGIMTRLASAKDEAEKTSAVISPNDLASIIALLKEGTVLRRVYPGMRSKELTPELAAQLNLPIERGLLVSSVKDDSPLNAAGLQAGDVVTGFGDVEIVSQAQFYQTISGMAVGAKVPLTVQRGEEQLTLQVILRGYKSATQDWLDLVVKHQKNRAANSERQ